MSQHLNPAEELRLHDRAMGASSCGITIADVALTDMPLIYINAAFENITGYTWGEVAGRNCRFLQGNDRAQPGVGLVRAALGRGESCTVVLRNYRKDGSLFWNELFMSPIYDGDRLTHFVGIQTDVTARKLAQEALVLKQAELEHTLKELRDTQVMLVQSEKMNALGQMVAGIAHEINNPLSYVNSNLHSLRGTLHDLFASYEQLEGVIRSKAAGFDPDIKALRQQSNIDFMVEDLDDLLYSSLDGLNRVKKIVEALRTFSRLDEAEIKSANLEENIRSTLMIAQGELQGRVEVILELADLPEIVCYPAELNQVFLNIIINAAQSIPDRGTLTIRGREEGEQVVLQFSDTGTGMTPEVIQQIFNPFFTTKPVGVGMGLGLAISYKIITDRHHGTIEVESTPGVGSTFILTLPKDVRR